MILQCQIKTFSFQLKTDLKVIDQEKLCILSVSDYNTLLLYFFTNIKTMNLIFKFKLSENFHCFTDNFFQNKIR